MLNTLRSLNESKASSHNLLNEIGNAPAPQGSFMGDRGPAEFGSEKEQQSSDKSAQDITNINDVDVKILNGGPLKDEQKNGISQIVDNFRDQVSQIVEFNPGMTISDRQIRLDGNLTDEDIKFTLIAGQEEGVYINADMLKLEQETVDVITKLVKFNQVYKTAVEPMITRRDNDI